MNVMDHPADFGPTVSVTTEFVVSMMSDEITDEKARELGHRLYQRALRARRLVDGQRADAAGKRACDG
jgi:hypothetical protein